MKRDKRGQEATEFVLISVLVFFSALLVVIIFGNKISSFFTSQSSAVVVAKKSSQTITANPQSKYEETVDAYNGPTQNPATQDTTIALGGQQVIQRSDGSLSFIVSGQNVTLSTQIKDLSNAVFETTGSSGAQDLVKEIAYMIQQHQSEHAVSNVPINVMFGSGTRVCNDDGATYKGNASAVANSLTIQVGNHVVIIQKDQKSGSNAIYPGEYRIEGNITNNNSFSGNVTSINTPSNPKGTITSKVDTSSGLNFLNADYSQTDKDNYSYDYTWNLNFARDKSYSI